MATVLSVFVRAYTQVSSSVAGTLVAAPRNAASGVSSVLWGWWDDAASAKQLSRCQVRHCNSSCPPHRQRGQGAT